MNAVNFAGGIYIGSGPSVFEPNRKEKLDHLETATWQKLDDLKRAGHEAVSVVYKEDNYDYDQPYYLVATQGDAVELNALQAVEDQALAPVNKMPNSSYKSTLLHEIEKVFNETRNRLAKGIYNKALRGETDV